MCLQKIKITNCAWEAPSRFPHFMQVCSPCVLCIKEAEGFKGKVVALFLYSLDQDSQKGAGLAGLAVGEACLLLSQVR